MGAAVMTMMMMMCMKGLVAVGAVVVMAA